MAAPYLCAVFFCQHCALGTSTSFRISCLYMRKQIGYCFSRQVFGMRAYWKYPLLLISPFITPKSRHVRSCKWPTLHVSQYQRQPRPKRGKPMQAPAGNRRNKSYRRRKKTPPRMPTVRCQLTPARPFPPRVRPAVSLASPREPAATCPRVSRGSASP